jgi:ATP-dependent RNA helicase DDX5/DBP2
VAASGDNGVGQFGVVQPAAQNYRLTAAEYRAEHTLQLQGDPPLPEPYQTFESVGFPHDILDEVLHVPRRGAAGLGAAWPGTERRPVAPVGS